MNKAESTGANRSSVSEIGNLSRVTNLRKRFESFKDLDKNERRENFQSKSSDIAVSKPQPPKKNFLIRTETMRDSAHLENRKGLIVNKNSHSEPTFSQSQRLSDDSSEGVYENIPQITLNEKPIHIYDEVYEVELRNPKPPPKPPKEKKSIRRTLSNAFRSSLKLSTSQPNLIQAVAKSPVIREESDKIPPPMIKELKLVLMKKDTKRDSEHFSVSTDHLVRQPEEKAHSEGDSLSSFDSWDDYEPVMSPSEVSLKNNVSKTSRIIQELFENEQTYINSLRQGIEDYIVKFDELSEMQKIPNSLKGQKLNLFSNIETIYDFHSVKFLPKLIECGYNPEKIANVFKTSIDDSQFDKYIIYVVNRKKSQKLCKENDYFFKQLQRDKLGINSFLLQPVQRLPRYQLLLGEIVKELLKDLDENKQAIAVCCVAEKGIQKLLNIVNEYCE